MMDDDPVFQDGDDGAWYFWDETGTQYLGPFDSKREARHGADDYGAYLATGFYSPNLARLAWSDGESDWLEEVAG